MNSKAKSQQIKSAQSNGLTVRTSVKAGPGGSTSPTEGGTGWPYSNHNETLL